MGKMAITPQKRVLEQNSQLPTPPKVWVSGFPSVDRNEKLVSAIMEMGKMAVAPQKMHARAKLPITPKVWVSGFLSVDGKLVSAIMENGKYGCSSPKMHPRAKLPITNPPKVWVSPEKCPRAKVFILPHESPMCSFTLPNI